MKECNPFNDNMAAYRDLYDKLEASFDGCELRHIDRASNEEANELANIGSTRAPIPPGVFLEQIHERSIKIPRKVPKDDPMNSEETEDLKEPEELEIEGIPEQVMLIEALWTRPFIAYLSRQELPEDQREARQIIRRSKSFMLINSELYKRSISGMFQRCIAPEDGRSILRDIHEGMCNHHAGSRSLVGKTFRAGFY